jgi:hypothetical protein
VEDGQVPLQVPSQLQLAEQPVAQVPGAPVATSQVPSQLQVAEQPVAGLPHVQVPSRRVARSPGTLCSNNGDAAFIGYAIKKAASILILKAILLGLGVDLREFRELKLNSW